MSQKPDVGINTTPTTPNTNRVQTTLWGIDAVVARSHAEIIKPQASTTTPNNTNQTTAAVMGSWPTVPMNPCDAID